MGSAARKAGGLMDEGVEDARLRPMIEQPEEISNRSGSSTRNAEDR